MMHMPNPLRPLDRALSAWADRGLREERKGVTRTNVVALVAWFTIYFALSVAGWWSTWLHDLAALAAGALAGIALLTLSGVPRRMTWQRGYRAGRSETMSSIFESRRRGLTFADWVVGEMQRDGIPVVAHHDDDGHVVGIDLAVDDEGDNE